MTGTPPRYRTIVADPPWPMKDSGNRTTPNRAHGGSWENGTGSVRLPYQRMSVAEITLLPIADLAERDAHLYLWTFGPFVPDAYRIAQAWGFRSSALLTWCKAPQGLGLGGAFVPTAEHILFCRRGRLAPLRRWPTTWFQFKRPNDRWGPIHSAKPEGFLDVVESVSPGPYLELFARRQRLGWDTWGNEALQHVEIGAA